MRTHLLAALAVLPALAGAGAADDPFRYYAPDRGGVVWTIGVEGMAPWAIDQKYVRDVSALAAPKATVAFRDGKVEAPAPLACATPKYSYRLVAGDKAFEGRLKDPATDLPAVGLAKTDVVALDDGCGQNFYFVDPYKAMFVVGDRLYSLNRDAPAGVRPDDRDRLQACLALVARNAKAEPDDEFHLKETPTADGRLGGAASDARRAPASCVGAIAYPCLAKQGSSNAGISECYSREQAVWDERLNRGYKQAMAKADPDVAAGYRKIQRAWIAFRDARCVLPEALMKGTGAGPMEAWCLMDETARQAVWIGEGEGGN